MDDELATGVCVWLTGLSGAGKSTTARAVVHALERRGYSVELLDGDEVRARDVVRLGYSASDREVQVRRVACLAREIVDRGGIVFCALISPYRSLRATAREVVGSVQFLEVFVNAPLSVCEARDTKGLYARARRGELKALTGIDDPYEEPVAPDLVLDTATVTLEENVARVVGLLAVKGFVRAGADDAACRT